FHIYEGMSNMKFQWTSFVKKGKGRRMVHIGSAALLIFVLLLAGCGAKPEASEHAQHRLPNGDIQEKTASVQTLPTFLHGKDVRLQQIHSLAAQHADLLEWIPCYCGCGDSAGHRNSLHCFVREIGDDGSVVWDDHGARCNVCLEIAVQSAIQQSEGKSVKEI